jgi:hypothetical protein
MRNMEYSPLSRRLISPVIQWWYAEPLGPGVVYLFNGSMDARKEAAPIIAIAGDVELSIRIITSRFGTYRESTHLTRRVPVPS